MVEYFDKVRAKHNEMDADEFNDDDTYKAGINEVSGVVARKSSSR